MPCVTIKRPKNTVFSKVKPDQTAATTVNSVPATCLYYYGARYLDPKTSRWLSGDPAMGEYIPQAPINDEARKHNGNLPGMGGIFNLVNMQRKYILEETSIKMVMHLLTKEV